MTYNGYENYQTYAVAVWLDTVHIDNEIIHIEVVEARARHPDNEDKVLSEVARHIKNRLNDKADYIRRSWDTHDNYGNPDDAFARIIIDMLNDAIEKVNFYEVARAFLEGE